MVSPFEKLKAADPQAARYLLEATGHVLAPHRGELSSWCRRVGVSLEELDAATRAYREGVERGQRPPHVDFW